MSRIAHAAGRKVFSGIVGHELSQINKDRQGAYEKILDTAEKYMNEFDLGINWEYLRRVTLNPEYTLNRYVSSMVEYWKRNPITYRLSTGGRFFAV